MNRSKVTRPKIEEEGKKHIFTSYGIFARLLGIPFCYPVPPPQSVVFRFDYFTEHINPFKAIHTLYIVCICSCDAVLSFVGAFPYSILEFCLSRVFVRLNVLLLLFLLLLSFSIANWMRCCALLVYYLFHPFSMSSILFSILHFISLLFRRLFDLAYLSSECEYLICVRVYERSFAIVDSRPWHSKSKSTYIFIAPKSKRC